MKHVTQTEIARIVGVTQRAVAAVVGAADPSKVRVSEATRLRILKVAKELGYRPQRQAQLLRGARSGTIGVINDVTLHQSDVALAFHISMKAHLAGYHLLTQELLWSNAEEVRRVLEVMVDARVEAVLLLSQESDIDITPLQKAGIPMIAVGVPAPGGVPYITPDYRAAMRDLVLHLHHVGHRRLLYTCPIEADAPETLRNWNVRERVAGVFEGAEAAGIPRKDIQLEWNPPTGQLFDYFESGYRFGREWEGRLPDAILSQHDYIAVGLYKAFHERKIEVPRDVAITGFNDSSLAAYSPVSITSVALPTIEMGDLALDFLFSVIRDSRPLESLPQATLLPCRIVPRASSGDCIAGIPPLKSTSVSTSSPKH
jgi:LacI family transcriptional regulator